MSVLVNSVAAATAVLGYDLLRDVVGRQEGRQRTLKRAGINGSAAAMDAKVDLMVGSLKAGSLYIGTTGAVTKDYLFDFNTPVPANTEVSAIVVDAPATNPINIIVEVG